jgi:small subunit ribosomal protein S4
LCRQVGEKLFLKGARCYTPDCAVDKRRRSPGTSRQSRRRLSEYGIRQREKQKLRYSYGLLETQFRGDVDQAQRQPGITGDHLLRLLERRLDNVVFRLGFAESRNQGRQFVRHGHVTVNGRKVDIPSFIVKTGDVVTWREQSKEKDFVKARIANGPRSQVPAWLSLDPATQQGKVVALPSPEDIDNKMDMRLIVEYYTR